MKASFEGRLATSRLALFVCRAGRGVPLLFLGGSNFDMRLRRPVFASALPDRFEVVAYEPRGLGRSDQPSGRWTMQDYADDACALLDALGWPRVCVVGESFGAMTAMELAIRYPQRVAKLCLMAGSSGGAGGSSYPIEQFLSLSPRARAVAALRVHDLRFDALMRDDPAAAEAKIADHIAADAALLGDPSNARGYPRLLAARSAHDVLARLADIRAPTIVMSGVHDGQAPMRNGRALADAIDGALLLSFAGGHSFGFDTAQPVERLLACWTAA